MKIQVSESPTTHPTPIDMVPEGRLSIRFWGVRGSIATPGPATSYYGGNTSCVEMRAEGQIVILDAGTGIRPLGVSLAKEANGRPLSLTLLLSHTHWDHIQGFPFFGPAYDPKNKLRILGYKGARDGLLTALSNQMSSYYFPVAWKSLPSSIELEKLKELQFTIGSIAVEAMLLNHPGGCVGYRFTTRSGSFAYMTDFEPFHRHAANSRSQSAGDPESLAKALDMDREVVTFLKDVDLLVMDAQYDADEYKSRVGWGHGCIEDTVNTAVDANVKRLFLFHHDPDHDDDKVSQMVGLARACAEKRGSLLKIDAAREGLEVVADS